MNTDNNINETFDDNFNPLEYSSWSNKIKKNKEYANKSADYIDSMISLQAERELNAKLYVNFGLINGRDIVDDPVIQKLVGADLLKKYSVTKGNKELKYIPLVDQVIKDIHGQQIRRPFNPTFFDKSSITKNEYKEKQTDLNKKYLEAFLISKNRERATLEYQMKYNIESPESLSIEDQQQMRADIEKRTMELNPMEVNKYMKYKFRSGIEIDGQTLLDIISEQFNIKFKSDNNIINLIASGKAIYYNGIRNGKVIFEPVNPIGFHDFRNKEDIFIENSDMIRREREISFIDIFKNHGSHIDTATYKKLLDLNKSDTNERGQLLRFANEGINSGGGKILDSKILTPFGGMKTEDVAKIKEYSNNTEELNFHKFTTERHYTWVTLRKMYEVTRIVNGKVEIYHRDHSYKENKNRKDIKVKQIMANEVHQTFRIGLGDGSIHLSKGLVPFLYPSMYDPYTVKLPYSGINYNLTMGNAKDIAPIDYAKPYILKTLITEKKLEDSELSDHGKITLFSEEGISKYEDISEVTASMKKHHAISLSASGIDIESGMKKQSRLRDLVDVIDLTSNVDQANKIKKVEYYFNLMISAVGSDPRLMNQSDKYVSKDVRENTIIQSSYKSEGLFGMHNMALESALLNFMNNAIANLDEDQQLELLTFSGTERILQEINVPRIKASMPYITVRTTNADIDNISASKELIYRFVSTSGVQLLYGFRVIWAQTKSELLEIAEEAQEYALERLQEDRAFQQQQMDLQTKAMIEAKEMENQLKLDIADKGIERSKIYSENMMTVNERQFDIDKDGRNDMEKIKDKDIAYKKGKDALDYEVAIKELKLKQDKINKDFKYLMSKIK